MRPARSFLKWFASLLDPIPPFESPRQVDFLHAVSMEVIERTSEEWPLLVPSTTDRWDL